MQESKLSNMVQYWHAAAPEFVRVGSRWSAAPQTGYTGPDTLRSTSRLHPERRAVPPPIGYLALILPTCFKQSLNLPPAGARPSTRVAFLGSESFEAVFAQLGYGLVRKNAVGATAIGDDFLIARQFTRRWLSSLRGTLIAPGK
jgi:hypothetical protein